MENTIRITGGRQGTSCPGCLEPLGPDEATRRCPEGHIAIHAECQDLVSSCPLLSCGLPLLTEPTFEELQSELDGAIITREVAADDGPAEGTRSRSRPRCPACGDDFEDDEGVVACASDHVAVHAECYGEGLVRVCPAIGCEDPLENRTVDCLAGGRVVLNSEKIEEARGEVDEGLAAYEAAREAEREARRERRRAMRAERARQRAEHAAARGRRLLRRAGLRGESGRPLERDRYTVGEERGRALLERLNIDVEEGQEASADEPNELQRPLRFSAAILVTFALCVIAEVIWGIGKGLFAGLVILLTIGLAGVNAYKNQRHEDWRRSWRRRRRFRSPRRRASQAPADEADATGPTGDAATS